MPYSLSDWLWVSALAGVVSVSAVWCGLHWWRGRWRSAVALVDEVVSEAQSVRDAERIVGAALEQLAPLYEVEPKSSSVN